MSVTPARERVDVVVVGARCAGAAAAIALAGAGRSVIAVDRSPFPSDTLPLRGARLAARAAARRGTDRRALLRELGEELRVDADTWREELRRPFRPTGVWASERPDFEVPVTPAGVA